VTVTLPGGQMLVEWRDDGHVWMTGPVETEFEGFIDPETLAWSAREKGAA
jgi:diaminopimelate epimerase